MNEDFTRHSTVMSRVADVESSPTSVRAQDTDLHSTSSLHVLDLPCCILSRIISMISEPDDVNALLATHSRFRGYRRCVFTFANWCRSRMHAYLRQEVERYTNKRRGQHRAFLMMRSMFRSPFFQQELTPNNRRVEFLQLLFSVHSDRAPIASSSSSSSTPTTDVTTKIMISAILNEALVQACWWGYDEATVRCLIALGGDVNTSLCRPFWSACSKGHDTVLRTLVDHDSSMIDVWGPPCMYTSISFGHTEIVRTLSTLMTAFRVDDTMWQ